jgi:hypothetical protein
VIVQREFGREFGIHRNRAVHISPCHQDLVRNFQATGSALKTKYWVTFGKRLNGWLEWNVDNLNDVIFRKWDFCLHCVELVNLLN